METFIESWQVELFCRQADLSIWNSGSWSKWRNWEGRFMKEGTDGFRKISQKMNDWLVWILSYVIKMQTKEGSKIDFLISITKVFFKSIFRCWHFLCEPLELWHPREARRRLDSFSGLTPVQQFLHLLHLKFNYQKHTSSRPSKLKS